MGKRTPSICERYCTLHRKDMNSSLYNRHVAIDAAKGSYFFPWLQQNVMNAVLVTVCVYVVFMW